jgi:RNA polymerase sigma-70 factor, ECF subfamily
VGEAEPHGGVPVGDRTTLRCTTGPSAHAVEQSDERVGVGRRRARALFRGHPAVADGAQHAVPQFAILAERLFVREGVEREEAALLAVPVAREAVLGEKRAHVVRETRSDGTGCGRDRERRRVRRPVVRELRKRDERRERARGGPHPTPCHQRISPANEREPPQYPDASRNRAKFFWHSSPPRPDKKGDYRIHPAFSTRATRLVEPDRTELLVRLLTQYQGELFRYVFTLLPNEEDARDALQETNVALYRKFGTYDPERPFLTWAYTFAYLEVLKQRDRNRRGTAPFSRELIERLAREREEHEPILALRLQALDHCLEALPAPDRDLICKRYQEKTRADDLAQEAGESRRTLFRNLDRIRRLLHDCITRRVSAGA